VGACVLAMPATGQAVTCGQVIESDTTLDSGLTNCPGPGLVIGADGITLDLNGHTIDGTGGTAVEDIGVANGLTYDTGSGIFEEPSHSGVTIKNGTIRDFRFAAANSGFEPKSQFEPPLTGNVFTNLVVTGRILVLQTDDGRIENNTLTGGRIDVIGSSRNRIVGNALVGGGFIGVNSDQYRGGRGANDNVVSHNTVRGSGASGIYLGYSLFEGVPSPSGTRIAANTVSNSMDDGILVEGIEAFPEAGADGTVLDGNTLTRNGDDGVQVQADSTTITANTANTNASLGIRAVEGIIDGGGNYATGNGDPRQCVNVVCKPHGFLFGAGNPGTSFSAMSANAKRASRFFLFFRATVTKLRAYLDGQGAATGTQVLRAVIYTDEGGQPGRPLIRSFQAGITAGAGPGWVTLPLPFRLELAPGHYWLGLHSGATNNVARFAWNTSQGARRFNVDNYLDGPSSPFGPAASDEKRIAIQTIGYSRPSG
jgi:Periplasmic copper-binding protein (NosD)